MISYHDRRYETISEWLDGQTIKPDHHCLWCTRDDWYKKNGAWFCNACDPKDILFTWPERLELIRRLRAGVENLEAYNDLPNSVSLSGLRWSDIINHLKRYAVEKSTVSEDDIVGPGGRADQNNTDESYSGFKYENTPGVAEPHTTDGRKYEVEERCVPKSIVTPGERKRLLFQELKHRFPSSTMEERQG